MNSKSLLIVSASAAVMLIFPFVSQPARAVSPEVEAAAKAISEIAADPTKLQAYCRVVKELEATAGTGDRGKYDAVVQQLEDLLRSFGPAFERAVELAEMDLDPEDEQALEDAYDAVEERCVN
jgi:hypothetical protein